MSRLTLSRAAVAALFCFVSTISHGQPVIGSTKVDVLTDSDGDNKADSGEVIKYTIGISNTGTANATGMTFTDPTPANTTLIGSSVNVSPLAFDDAYSTVGNTLLRVGGVAGTTPERFIAGASVKDNDTEFFNDAPGFTHFRVLAVTGGSSTQGGVVNMANDGSFTYLPPLNFTGTDTFTYSLEDDGPDDNFATTADNLTNTNIGTVAITVTNKVWYVDNTAGTTGDGRSTSPFDSLADVSGASGPDVAGDIIYLRTGGSGYTGGITLLNNQTLWGENEALVVAALTLKTAGTDPVITNAGGAGVTLASGNTLKGFTVGNTSTVDITNTPTATAGTVTISNVDLNGTGRLFNIDTASTLAVTLDTTTTTSATGTGINLMGCGGTFTANGASMAGVSGDDVLINGGTVTAAYNGTITNTAGRAVNIANKTASGNVTFTGAISDTATGILLDNNDGATVSFTGGLNLSTTTNAAFTATNGGTVTATQNNTSIVNTLTTTTGTALNISNTTIGAAGLTFRSISANGAANGILLNTTGASGGLAVTGNGTVNSGGTITNTTGVGISLNSAANTSFTRMLISNTGSHGVSGSNLSDPNTGDSIPTFELRNSRITSPGDADAEEALHFGNNGSPANNTGTITIADSIIEQFEEFGLTVANSSGALTLNVTGTRSGTSPNFDSTMKFEDNNDTHGESAILVVGTGSATINVNVQGIYTNNVEGSALLLSIGGNAPAGAASSDVNVIGNAFNGAGGPDNFPNPAYVVLGSRDQDTLTFDVQGNDMLDAREGVVVSGDGSVQGRIGGSTPALGNRISGVAFDALRIDMDGVFGDLINSANFTWTVLVQNNTLTGLANQDQGMQILNRDHVGTLNLTVENNTISDFLAEGIRYFSGERGSPVQGDTTGVVRIANNTFSNNATAGNFDLSLRSTDQALTSFDITGNTNSIGAFTIDFDEAETSDMRLEQTSLANVSTLNGSATTTNSQGAVTFNISVNPPLPANPLLFAADESAMSGSGAPDSVTSAIAWAEAARLRSTAVPPANADIASDVSDKTPPTTTGESPVLVQSQLDSLVAAARSRWEMSGLSEAQLAELDKVTFEVADLPGWYLGEASGHAIRVDNNAGGNGWFIDTTPLDDAEFSNSLEKSNATARVDLLTTLMHEMGHSLGLCDSYSNDLRGSVMYGFLTKGERRLPKSGEARNAVPHDHMTPHFLSGPITIGTLPPGKSVTIVYQTTVDPALPLGTFAITSQGTVSGSNFANILTDDPSVGGASDPTVTPVDRPDTTVVSVNRVTSTPTNAGSLSWTVTFADAIISLTGSNFSLASAGLGGAPAITGVVAVGGTPATQWTLTASTGSGNGTLGLNMANDTALSHDVTNLPVTGQVYTIDRTPPDAGIALSDTALKIGETSLVTITFTEAVTGFDNADLTIPNGALSPVATIDNLTWTATLTPDAPVTDATNVITLAKTGVIDAAGNTGVGSAVSPNYAVDTALPTAGIVVADSALRVGETSLVTITFNEAVTGFDNGDLAIANGALSAVSSGDGGITWTATLTPTAGITDPSNLITLDNTGVTDSSGNVGTGTTDSNNYAIDTLRPTATVVVADTALAAGETSLVTITFSEAVSGFTTADLAVANGAVTGLSTSDGGITWTATLTPSISVTDATNLITLDNTGLTDLAGNPGTGTTDSNNYAIDTQRPTVTVVVADTTLAAGETSLVTLTFNEAITGLTTADLTVANGAVSGLITSDGGITWTGTLTPTASVTDISNLITLDNTGVQDAAGNTGTGTTDSNNYAIDTARPTATLVVADDNLMIGETSLVTITFSEAVTGFSNADLIIPNGTLSAVSTGDGGITWTATLTPTPNVTDATNVITLDNSGVTDAAGNTGTGTTDSNNYAVTSLSVSIAANAASAAEGTGAGTTAFTFTVSRTGSTTGDVTMDFAVTGAANAADFGGTLPSGQFAIPNGQASAVLTINASRDSTVEPDEAFTVTLSNASGGFVISTAAASSTITNDDFEADLAITVTDGVATAVPGGSVTYTITASNSGPHPATGATLVDTFPASLSNVTWTSVGAGGGSATPAGSGNINDTVNLPVGASVTYTVNATLSAAATGTLVNTATVSSAVTDPNPANNSATDTDTLIPQADLSITKTDGVATAIPGGSVTYTITASNSGPSNVVGATVADTFPASLTTTWTAVGAGGGSAPANGSGNINAQVNLPVGGSVTFTVSATISAAATGTLVNTATIGSAVTDPNPANNSATDTDTLTPQADLAITKTDGVTTAVPGSSVTYTITAGNSGLSHVTGATVSDTFPASLTATWTAVGAGGGSAPASGSGNINAPVTLPPGGSVTFTVSATISASATGNLSNTATVTAPAGVTDPNPGNNSATDTDTLTPQADLTITKTDGVTTATPGGSVTYTITASNAGPSSVTGATVADTLPASIIGATWTAVGAGGGTATATGAGNINDTVNLPAGGSVTYTVTAPISAAATGTLSNTATVSSTVTDPVPANNSATDTDTLNAQADLAITKTDGVTTATPGTSVTYTITASNAGPSNVTGATVADTLPAIISGATWTAIGAGGGTATAAGAGNINDTVNLPAGGSVTYTVTAPISAGATGTLINTATVSSAVTDPNPANNSATDTDTLTPQADLAITKTDGVATAVPGNTVTYTITASNAGPSSVTAATVSDTLPGIITGATWTATGAGGGTATAAGAGNINDTVNLPAGASVTYTVTAPISSSATGTLVNTATVSSSVTDPNPGNNSATDTDTLTPQADLAVTLTDSPDPVNAAGNLTYTITLTNNGPSAAASPVVSLPLPASTTFVSATAAAGWTTTTPAVGGTGTVSFTIVSLASGGTASFTVVAKVDLTVVNNSTLTATATAASATTDPTPANDSATATTLAKSGADLQITLADSPDPVVAGTNLTYTLQVANSGPLDADNVSVTDTLPAGTTFVSLTAPAGWTATTPAVGGTGSVTITRSLFAVSGSATFTLVVTVGPGVANGTIVTDTASVTSTTIDIVPGNNSATTTSTVTTQSDLAIQITGTPSTAPKGSNVTYAVTLTNNGPSNASAPNVSLPIPSQMTFVSATAPAGWSATTPAVGANGTVNFSAATLASGATVNFTVVAKVNANAPTGAILTAIVTASATGVEPVPANNVAASIASVGTVKPTAVQPVTTGIKVNPQTGLFDVNVKVTNTTPLPINGFRLRVNFDAYKAAYPSLRLENATSTSKKTNVYIDYPNAVAVNATVTVKLSFYTSTRTFPSPFTPVLTVDLLASSQAAPIGGGVQPGLAKLADQTMQLTIPTVPGRWYRVRYSPDLVRWIDCPVPFLATAASTLWIDNGPPYTVAAPAVTPARFYLVDEIEAP